MVNSRVLLWLLSACARSKKDLIHLGQLPAWAEEVPRPYLICKVYCGGQGTTHLALGGCTNWPFYSNVLFTASVPEQAMPQSSWVPLWQCPGVGKSLSPSAWMASGIWLAVQTTPSLWKKLLSFAEFFCLYPKMSTHAEAIFKGSWQTEARTLIVTEGNAKWCGIHGKQFCIYFLQELNSEWLNSWTIPLLGRLPRELKAGSKYTQIPCYYQCYLQKTEDGNSDRPVNDWINTFTNKDNEHYSATKINEVMKCSVLYCFASFISNIQKQVIAKIWWNYWLPRAEKKKEWGAIAEWVQDFWTKVMILVRDGSRTSVTMNVLNDTELSTWKYLLMWISPQFKKITKGLEGKRQRRTCQTFKKDWSLWWLTWA